MPAIEPCHQYLSRFEAATRQARDHHSALTRDSTTHGTQRQNPLTVTTPVDNRWTLFAGAARSTARGAGLWWTGTGQTSNAHRTRL